VHAASQWAAALRRTRARGLAVGCCAQENACTRARSGLLRSGERGHASSPGLLRGWGRSRARRTTTWICAGGVWSVRDNERPIVITGAASDPSRSRSPRRARVDVPRGSHHVPRTERAAAVDRDIGARRGAARRRIRLASPRLGIRLGLASHPPRLASPRLRLASASASPRLRPASPPPRIRVASHPRRLASASPRIRLASPRLASALPHPPHPRACSAPALASC
jgi:hypothetical protein